MTIGGTLMVDQTDFVFTHYQNNAGDIVELGANNNASVANVYKHPTDLKFIVLIGQQHIGKSPPYGNISTAIRDRVTYNPELPDFLKNGSYLKICQVAARKDASSTRVNSVNVLPIGSGESAGQAFVTPVVTGVELPDPTISDILVYILQSGTWRDGLYYKQAGKWLRQGDRWRAVDEGD